MLIGHRIVIDVINFVVHFVIFFVTYGKRIRRILVFFWFFHDETYRVARKNGLGLGRVAIRGMGLKRKIGRLFKFVNRHIAKSGDRKKERERVRE